jgi:predicted DNA-binding protein
VIRDKQVSLRLPADLKRDVQKIADATNRTLSNAVEMLIRRGVEDYKRDGMLIDVTPKRRGKKGGLDPASEQFANELVEKLFDRLRREKL